MLSRISVRLLVSVDLVDFAEEVFPRLMTHPDYREDALQELRMVDAFLPQATSIEKRRTARQALTWLQYMLGVSTVKPRCARPAYDPLPVLEEGSFLKDLAERLEAARMYEAAA